MLFRGDKQPAWADLELEALKAELRERVAAIAEREADLDAWARELERREARLERQRHSVRRRRRQVLVRLVRLRGRAVAQALSQNGNAPVLDEEPQNRAAEVVVEPERPKAPATKRAAEAAVEPEKAKAAARKRAAEVASEPETPKAPASPPGRRSRGGSPRTTRSPRDRA